MVLNSVDVLVDALRESDLLRAEQLTQLANAIAPQFEDTQELARHIVKLGWISLYQAKKLLSGHGSDLVLGHYVIIEKIGEGGMGKVYKAKQLRLGRTVALKVVRPALLANETAMKRFHREAKSAAQLTHPNIVRLFDADQIGDRHFLAMEYVEGSDLTKFIKDHGPLSIGLACSFIRQAASGLQHAHDLGLVHRDIKPSNLLVAAGKAGKSGGGILKILDMGLARATESDSDSDATALTQAGTVIGTPDFMSPEQAKNSSNVDGRSDLYSLGCTLFYLLTGQTPFPRGSTLEKLLQHQIDPPPHIQLLRQDVPDELAAILHSLLAKRPEDRFQSGHALATALEPWSEFDSGSQRPRTGDLPTAEYVPEAEPVMNMPTVTPDKARTQGDPFAFDEMEEPPAPPLSLPTEDVSQAETPRKRPVKWLLGLAALPLLVIGGLLIAREFNKSGPPPTSEQPAEKKEDPQQTKKDQPPPPKKNELEPFEPHLPPDTQIVAVLNVQQLAKSKFFEDKILPRFTEQRRTFMAAAKFDPLKAIDRIVLAIPKAGSKQLVILVQGRDFLTAEFLSWLAKLPGVGLSKETILKQPQTHDIYLFPPNDRNGDDEMFAAVLPTNPPVAVLSTSRDRVIEALTRAAKKGNPSFDDGSLRPMLAKYGKPSPLQPSLSPPTLWMCVGNQAQLLGFGKPKDSGIQALIGQIRLGEGMDFDVSIEAGTRNETTQAWGRIATIVREVANQHKDDKRLGKIASLFVEANPGKNPDKKNGPFVGQWSHFVEPKQMSEWLAPFLSSESSE